MNGLEVRMSASARGRRSSSCTGRRRIRGSGAPSSRPGRRVHRHRLGRARGRRSSDVPPDFTLARLRRLPRGPDRRAAASGRRARRLVSRGAAPWRSSSTAAIPGSSGPWFSRTRTRAGGDRCPRRRCARGSRASGRCSRSGRSRSTPPFPAFRRRAACRVRLAPGSGGRGRSPREHENRDARHWPTPISAICLPRIAVPTLLVWGELDGRCAAQRGSVSSRMRSRGRSSS